MKTTIYILLFSFTVSLSFSQENKDTKESIENQFEEIYKKSNSYQAYKIIKKRYYQDLKQNTLDSLERSKKIISDKDRLLFTQKNKLKKDSILLSKTTLELKDSIKREKSISFLGILVSKKFYNLLLWGIVIILLMSLSLFIVKFIRNNRTTKKAQRNVIDLEEEFELFRKKSVQREQKLRRQLQDEINKQRKN
jgi:hypothetical protein